MKYDSQFLHAELMRVFGFAQFKGNQEAIVRNVLEGKDSFVIMPTGGGKSLCYQLPALILPGTAIIVSPLIALMKNQVDAVRSFGSAAKIAHYLNSSLSKAEMRQVKDDLASGQTKLLYVAPETLTKEENVEFFQTIPISLYAIDEAHCISEWGHDFRPEYRRLRPIIEQIGRNVPVIALTATATPKVQKDIQKNLGMMDAKVFISSFNRENLYYEVRPKTKNVDRDIVKFIRDNSGKSGIVYCLSRKKVEEFAEVLCANGIRALPYHAGLDAQTRATNQDRFLMEDVDVIVATIAFGMGIDKPDVRFVIHYDMPKSLEGYYQETGRAGRDGGEGKCIAFYCEEDIIKLEKFLKDKQVSEQEVARQLMAETISYAETSMCRRKHLLHYFGEKYETDNCHNCDNCLYPKQKEDATEQARFVIQLILDIKQQFKTDYIVAICMGKLSPSIKNYKHNLLPQFGKGKDRDERYWKAVIRQCIIEDLLGKDIEDYGVVKVTPAGEDFVKNPFRRSILLLFVLIGVADRLALDAVCHSGEQAENRHMFCVERAVDDGIRAFDFAHGIPFRSNRGAISKGSDQQNVVGCSFSGNSSENLIRALQILEVRFGVGAECASAVNESRRCKSVTVGCSIAVYAPGGKKQDSNGSSGHDEKLLHYSSTPLVGWLGKGI